MAYRRAQLTIIVAASAIVAASCGSRTGLFGSEPNGGTLPDATADGAELDAGVDAFVPCVPGRFDLDLATAQLMFVLDRSRSMSFSLDGTEPNPRTGRLPAGLRSRWQVLESSLSQVITPFDRQISMGAKFFPETLTDDQAFDSELACRTESGVAIAPAIGNASKILDVFTATKPLGGTPTAEAVRLAAQFLSASRSVARTIILATDGAPNCNSALDERTCVCTTPEQNCHLSPDRGPYSCLDDTRAITTIRDVANAQRIPVYVIGIGSTERPEFRVVLDEMAVAGGRPRPTTPRHYSVQTEDELTSAFTSIRDSIAKCTYLTPSSPNDPNAITIEVNGVRIFRDPTRTNGWDWIDQSFGEIGFFGDACTLAQGGDAGTGPTTPPTITGVVSCEP